MQLTKNYGKDFSGITFNTVNKMSDKRQRIISAAKENFCAKGLEKTKIADITKTAGIALGTFYLYFPSKFSVLPHIAVQLVQRLIDEVQKDFDPEAHLREKVEHVVDGIFRCMREGRDVYALLLAGLTPTGYSKQWDHLYKPFYEWVSDFLREYQDKGMIRAEINTYLTAKLFLGVVETTAEQLFIFNESTEEDVRLQKQELMAFIKHAILADEALV